MPAIKPVTIHHVMARLRSVAWNANVVVSTIATARKFVGTSVRIVATYIAVNGQTAARASAIMAARCFRVHANTTHAISAHVIVSKTAWTTRTAVLLP